MTFQPTLRARFSLGLFMFGLGAAAFIVPGFITFLDDPGPHVVERVIVALLPAMGAIAVSLGVGALLVSGLPVVIDSRGIELPTSLIPSKRRFLWKDLQAIAIEEFPRGTHAVFTLKSGRVKYLKLGNFKGADDLCRVLDTAALRIRNK